MADLTVPQLGESITEAVVGKWNKKVGDAVKADEPIVMLETDKVTIDVVAPSSGTLSAITRKEGDKVKIGEIVGSITEGAAGAVAAAPAKAPEATPAQAQSSGDGRGPKMTPVASKVVEERGLDPSKIAGSGAGGRIMKGDVMGQQAPAEAPAAPKAPSGPRPHAEREERVKMTPLRKRVAERLLQAQSTAAILTTFNEVDMGEVMALRKQYQDSFVAKHGTKLGFMSFFVRAVIEGLRAFPQINAEIDGDEVVFKRYYDIGVAVSGSRGLVVPVIRDADQLSLADIEKKITEYGTKAKTDKLTLSDLQGGTFTISNGGIFGSMLSTPILNPPQTGILGMHNIVDRAVVKNGEVVVRPVMYLALSYDHRLVDGREAVQFLVTVKNCIEDPRRLLLEI